MLFFTSDLHFGSENSIESNDRPFKNAKIFLFLFVWGYLSFLFAFILLNTQS